MLNIMPLESTKRLAELKTHYIQRTTAPLDGMWLCGFVPMAKHFGICDNDELVGFFCVNDEGYLLQFYVDDSHRERSSQLFERIVQSGDTACGKICGAFASTAEPSYVSLCLDTMSTFEVNALMYQLDPKSVQETVAAGINLSPIRPEKLVACVNFAAAAIGAPTEWLNGYFGNLITRQELFGVWDGERLIATGESRGYQEFQVGYADVGVIVAEAERGKGVATRVLQRLVAMNEANSLKSICSTEKTNVAAQKAITRSGFVSNNRIVQFHL